MPSLYAHYRFGTQLLPRLPADIRGTITRHRAMFDAGLQGPDFFFYHKPGAHSAVRHLGSALHRQTGREFFTRSCRGLRIDSDEEVLAYLYGLLGHYCLDSVCHPYIHEQSGGDSRKHNAMESEFERFLLAQDGARRPHAHRRSKYLHLTKAQCGLIAPFYAPATAQEIHEAATAMAHVTDLLTSGSGLYRLAAKGVLRTLGTEKLGLLMGSRPDEEFAASNAALCACYDRALDRYPELMDRLRDHLTFREPLGAEFDAIFG